MGLLDELAGAVFGGARGGPTETDAATGGVGLGGDASRDQAGALARGVLEMLQGHPGGLDGFAERFRQAGLGSVVDSWIGTGANRSISPPDLGRVLGPDMLSDLARRAGLGGGRLAGAGAGAGAAVGPDLSAVLAQILPLLVDRLTPDGRTPQGGSLLQIGLDLLRGGGAAGSGGGAAGSGGGAAGSGGTRGF